MFYPKDLSIKGFLRKQNNDKTKMRRFLLSDKLDKHKIQELREMVKEKAPDQPVEKVLAVFCERHGLTSGTCRYYYNLLVETGDIKEK
jgi:hypothetical protein